ncbi:ATP-grasp domain-containing protein [Bdellovibrio sp. HCB290]|uniref:arsenate reductase/protein-tyrosine-phosphatase family protein n=1 Tax=Bdellovibrio sp. HCB290 TaxID=3394356 RepID=UPI0039B4E3AE
MMARSEKNILILDGDMVSSLAIVRSLALKGWNVHVASPVEHGIASTSRFVKSKMIHPDPLKSEKDFLLWCEFALSGDRFDLIIPVTERTLVPLMKLRQHPQAKKLAMAANDALEKVLDKNKTTELAMQLGLPLPNNFTLTTQEEGRRFVDQPAVMESLLSQGPLVLKPGRSIGTGKEGRKKLEVKYAFTQEEARSKIENLLNFGEVIVQEYFQGLGVGVNVLASNGEVLYAFQHQRVHELPLTGGASCLRKSVKVESALLAATESLMKALSWTGVAMVEFKWNPQTGRFILVEINGRFWGSLPLAVGAGADFPAMLAELILENRVSSTQAYTPEIYARNLKTDLQWYEQVLRGEAPRRFKGPWQNKKEMLKDALRIFSPRHVLDVEKWSDPVPGLFDIMKIGSSYLNRIKDILIVLKQLQHHRFAWTTGKAQKCLRGSKKILFICYGNINRSALAERYFKQIAPNSKVEVISAGFHSEDHRPADPVMIEESRKLGINMDNWSSHKVTEEMFESSDAILVMENEHWLRIKAEYPKYAEKTFLLGFAAADVPKRGEIQDPYGKSRNFYQRAICEISCSIAGLINIINL